ncbi:sulfatase-like hydrolase/transferase [Flagellimonas myxillae]|uniref:sulfatase-like hydrolase/transferase n=1 Tax=Flagellimonas myxillae TaxID=2942214 RepID=UPI00201F6B30|nr:sulfatase-like hydrolase/transferase [Muricauda myxillae]MCL6265915.1 sulfatase-like hydrolase/transferase [Muricauda myxillae]
MVLLWTVISCKSEKKEVETHQQPNIILIMADDLGFETLGVNGSNSYTTPKLDRLAREGMRFTHCYSTPLCTPSRVQLMTGKYNFRNYIGFGMLDPNEKTFGHYLKEEGYTTFVAGKWQLLGNGHQQELAGNRVGTMPNAAGFDEFCLWQVDERGSRYKDPLLSTSKKGIQEYPGRFGPDIFVDEINAFMRSNKDQPFFVYYPMVLTHDPFVPTPENPEFMDFDANSKTNDPKYFGEMVQYMDRLLGRLVAEVETLGIRENTLIMFVGDNGTDRDVTSVINNESLKGHKGYTTNAGTHVPFIASWPGHIKSGSINDNLIDFTDFLPTLMETAAQKKLGQDVTDGLSFYPQLVGEDYTPRDWIFCHYAPNWGKFENKRYVQDKSWKLYESGALYDLSSDGLEQQPLVLEEQPPHVKERVETFKKVLAEYR